MTRRPIYPSQLEIGKEEGFSDEKDILRRKGLGERLASFLERTSHGTVIAVEGPWGSGKSTFLAMWAGHMRLRGHSVLEINAFELDYIEDPFIALSTELATFSKGNSNRETTERFINSAARSC